MGRVIDYVCVRACAAIDFSWLHRPEGDKVFRSHHSRQTDRPGSRPDVGAAAKEGRRHSRFMCASLPPQTHVLDLSLCTLLYSQKCGRVVCAKRALTFLIMPQKHWV